MNKSDAPDEWLTCLKEKFGYPSFKDSQLDVLKMLLLEARDVLAVMPTGSGKSLLYQFIAVYLKRPVLVISPLISLIDDQCLSLQAKGINALALHSSSKVSKDIDSKYRLIYTTPERVADGGLVKKLRKHICMVAIDEAHCASQWGPDFRPSYRELHRIRQQLGTNGDKVPILALTATATPKVQEDIKKYLKLTSMQVYRLPSYKPNMSIAVHNKSRDILNDLRGVMGFSDRLRVRGSIIIYCLSRKATEEVYHALNKAKYSVDYYHAKRTPKQRAKVHRDFLYDKITIVVATIAFAMGIDKPNVRMVINYGIPLNMMTYYQEIGRAGRDLKECQAHLFYGKKDFQVAKFLISQIGDYGLQQHQRKQLKVLSTYIESNFRCRQSMIEEFLSTGDIARHAENQQCCGKCDNRANLDAKVKSNSAQNVTTDGFKVMQLIQSLSCSYGPTRLIEILRGSNSAKMTDQLKRSIMYGRGKNKPNDWWRGLIETLVEFDYLQSKPFHTGTVLSLTSKGYAWVNQTPPPDLLLPLPASVGSRPPPKINPIRADRIRQIRQELVDQLELPPHVICSDQVIDQLSILKPTTIDDLHGLNNEQKRKYGKQLLNAWKQSKPKKTHERVSPTTTASVKKPTDDELMQQAIGSPTTFPYAKHNITNQILNTVHEQAMKVMKTTGNDEIEVDQVVTLCPAYTQLQVGLSLVLLSTGETQLPSL